MDFLIFSTKVCEKRKSPLSGEISTRDEDSPILHRQARNVSKLVLFDCST